MSNVRKQRLQLNECIQADIQTLEGKLHIDEIDYLNAVNELKLKYIQTRKLLRDAIINLESDLECNHNLVEHINVVKCTICERHIDWSKL